jgi:hypothetical protein
MADKASNAGGGNTAPVVASERTLRTVDRLRSLIGAIPPGLPTAENPTVQALKLHVAQDVHNRVTVPEGMDPRKAHAIVAEILSHYATSPEYRRAVAAPGSWRHDLDGNPVEPVSQLHADHARQSLNAPPLPMVETVMLKISALKVSLLLTPEQVPWIGEMAKAVDLKLDMGDKRPITVSFSAKNYRRVRRQVDELLRQGHQVVILLQGRLVAGGRIEGAGMAVQAKAPKVTEG